MKTTNTPAGARPAAPNFTSKSVTCHIVRGVIGFGLIIGGIVLVPFAGPATLLAAPLGLVALRGCPTCWAVGLVQTVSRERLERNCVEGVCTLTKADPAKEGHRRAERRPHRLGHLPVNALTDPSPPSAVSG